MRPRQGTGETHTASPLPFPGSARPRRHARAVSRRPVRAPRVVDDAQGERHAHHQPNLPCPHSLRRRSSRSSSRRTASRQVRPTASDLAVEIEALRNEYEARLKALESQLSALEAESKTAEGQAATPAQGERPAPDNVFNPAISVVLNGMFTDYSREDSAIPGFQTVHESERAAEGLSLGHSEIALSSNIDDKFQGALTLGLGVHPGEPAELRSKRRTSAPCPAWAFPTACGSRRGAPSGRSAI